VERIRDGDHLAYCHPAETVHGGDGEPHREDGVNLGEVCDVIANIRRRTGAQGGADGHRRTAVGEVRQCEREHEERRAIFAELGISADDSDRQNVQCYIHDDNCTDDDGFEFVEIAHVHITRTV